MSRRAWLRLAATSALLPLFLRDGEMSARADAGPSLRLIILMQHNGTSMVPGRFWPDATGSSQILAPLLQNPRLRERTTILKGLFNTDGGAGNQHDQGFAGLWSGRRTIGSFADPWGSGPSVDQILRRELTLQVPYPTLNVGVLASDTPRFKEHRFSFSYVAARQPIPTQTDPFRLFTRLFAPAMDPALAARRAAQQRSVLDHGTRDLARIRDRLGSSERDKLDIHATAIREYEQRLALLATAHTSCAIPTAPAQIDVTTEANVPTLLPTMLDLVALAVTCRLTQIVTFPMGAGGEKWRYHWLGIDKNSHDEIAHKDDGKDAAITEYVTNIGRWQCEHVARLALALDAVPEGNGTVLDNTLIVWGNEMATGQHGMENIPVVFIGGTGSRKRPIGLVDVGPQDYHRLGCTVMNLMGAPKPGFGELKDCGPLQGLGLI